MQYFQPIPLEVKGFYKKITGLLCEDIERVVNQQ